MRKCRFCQSAANSLEDVWPHWIVDQFRQAEPTEMHAERHGTTLTPWRMHQPQLAMRCVCQPCNNGWMSQLEAQAKPYLQPLLMGQPRVLNNIAQTTIALWSVKTAMVLEALDDEDKRIYTPEQCKQLRTLSAIPWRSSVWLAKSAVGTLFMSTKNRHLNDPGLEGPSGASITMAFAHAVTQVLTIRLPGDVGQTTRITTNVRVGPWTQNSVQIWPIQSSEINWPPPICMDGENGLNAFSERFSTSSTEAIAMATMQI
jgi:hypothetical protein